MAAFLKELMNNAVRYVVNSHVGYLFKNDILAENITYASNLTSVHLRNMDLSVEFTNSLFDQFDIPFKVVGGYIEEIHFFSPWPSFITSGVRASLEFVGLHLILEPKEDIDDAASVWSSAIGRLVEKASAFGSESPKDGGENPVLLHEGAKKVDELVRFIMSRVEVIFRETTLVFQPRGGEHEIKLSLRLDSFILFNELSEKKLEEQEQQEKKIEDTTGRLYDTKKRAEGSQTNTAFTKKRCEFSGVSISLYEVPNERRSDKGEIEITRLCGKNIMHLLMRPANDEGPRLSINTELADLIICLSPRQLYLLSEFMEKYSKLDYCSSNKSNLRSRPMTDSDYEKLESILQQQTHQGTQSGGLQAGYGWSGYPVEECEEQFYSMSGDLEDEDCAMSMISVGGASLSSSIHSTLYSERGHSTTGRAYGRGLHETSRAMSITSSGTQRVHKDSEKEIYSIELSMSSVAAVLLHDDILNITADGKCYTKESISKMQELSSKVFHKAHEARSIPDCIYNEDQVRAIFDETCPLNHLRLFCKPIELSVQVDALKDKCEGLLKISNLTLSECLFENKDRKIEEVPVLKFEEPSDKCVCLNFKTRKGHHTRSNLVLTVAKCATEIDISMIDRLAPLLKILPFSKGKEESSYGVQSKYTTQFELDIPYVKVKLRFPIPDFRPLHDPKRVPWWKRNVRSDFMTLECYEFKLQTCFSSQVQSPLAEYNIQFNVIDVYYNESIKATPYYFAKVGHPKFGDCTVTIKSLPITQLVNYEEMDDEATRTTFSEDLLQKADNGPFTSKRVVHHSRAEHTDDNFPESEFLIPGDSKELEEFKVSSRSSTKLIISVFLSSVKCQIISKHIYEMIYNRIINDLLIWEPSAPTPKNYEDIFSECENHSFKKEDSDYTDTEDFGLFHSFHEAPRQQEVEASPTYVAKYVNQSKLVLDVKIANGTLTLNPNVKDASLHVIPEQLAYISVDVSEANIFLVTGYKGDNQLDYFSVDVKNCDMRHNDMMSSSEVKMWLPDDRRIPSGHLYPVIAMSWGALAEDRKDQPERPMLTVGCKILTKHSVKTVQIALGLNKATLCHRMVAEPNSWISQLIDFFKVTDFPIHGYKSKAISEFHIHTWDCAIDYRPLHLPLRCAVTLGSFNMTSNVIDDGSGSKLRFLAEDCDVYISQEHPPTDGIASTVAIDIKEDYINVVNLNMLEVSLVTSDKINSMPLSDFRVSNDCLKIHTCADTLKALCAIIGYIASDGDLISNEPTSPFSSPKHGPGDEELIPVDLEPVEDSEVSEKQRQKIYDLLDEAINEEIEEKKEKVRPMNNYRHSYMEEIQRELGYAYSSDDEFVIIDEDNSEGLILKNESEVEWFTTLTIVYEYFPTIVERRDLLTTPSTFPVPVDKFTVCEFNIIWQLYGGHDFKKREEKNKQLGEQYLYNDAVADYFSINDSFYSKTSSPLPSYRERRISEREHWKTMGGSNRNQEILLEVALNKIRCQYDVYPETTHEAQRFVLQIKEFEINDRLKNSEFNKFLCQYISESMPLQTQGHMFSLETINTRPADMMGETECSLETSLLPLRFYIDQETLEFIFKFFNDLVKKPGEENAIDMPSSKQHTPIHQPPKLVIKKKADSKRNDDSEDENLIDFTIPVGENRSTPSETVTSADKSNRSIFMRPITFGPETFIKVDYRGKFLLPTETSMPGLYGLFMSLAQLNNTTIRLKSVTHRIGINGLYETFKFILDQLIEDITKNQYPNVICSLAPMQSLVQFFSGIRDLVCLPVEQYQKDGRLVKGLRMGAHSFATSTALATLELAFKLINLIQVTAETAYDILSPGPSVKQITYAKKKKRKYTQPQDISEGVSNAVWLLKEGIGETGAHLVRVLSHEHEQKGYIGVVGGLTRETPGLVVKPIMIATEATNNVIEGVRSQFVPDAKTEARQKWRND